HWEVLGSYLEALGAELGALGAATEPPAAVLSPSPLPPGAVRGKSGKARPCSDWPAAFGREALSLCALAGSGGSHSGFRCPLWLGPPSHGSRGLGVSKGPLGASKGVRAHAQRTGPWIAVLLQWPVVAAGSRGPGSPRLSVWKGWEQPWVPARIREARAGLKPCHGEAQAPQQCLHFSSCPSELSTASAQSSGACLLGSAGGQASLLCVHGPHGSTLQSELTVCTGGGVLEWDQLRGLQGLHFAFHSTGQASQMCSSSRMGTRAPAAAVNPSARTLVPLQPGPAAWQGDLLWLGSCGLQMLTEQLDEQKASRANGCGVLLSVPCCWEVLTG
ncbi:uncharacterized protein LOC135173876, partial [Pogoniulus pusillus]|uniref:uncharacterized protein LOC135173876 n=1 Tax=Pogoniulus pusillus TaxID=488313 RepID=UPI0030B95D2A